MIVPAGIFTYPTRVSFLYCWYVITHAVLPDAMVRLDPPLQRVQSDMRKYIPVGLEMPVDRLEIAESRVSHGYFLLKTKIGSLLKALFPMCFSPTILLS